MCKILLQACDKRSKTHQINQKKKTISRMWLLKSLADTSVTVVYTAYNVNVNAETKLFSYNVGLGLYTRYMVPAEP